MGTTLEIHGQGVSYAPSAAMPGRVMSCMVGINPSRCNAIIDSLAMIRCPWSHALMRYDLACGAMVMSSCLFSGCRPFESARFCAIQGGAV